jgi:para-aminobenzoate synthetase component 1
MPSPSPFFVEIPGPLDAASWAAGAHGQHAVAWLDGDGGRTAGGRFSILTWNPHRIVKAWGDRILDEEVAPVGNPTQSVTRGDPLAALARILNEEAVPLTPNPSPLPFVSGAIMALGFELADWIERLPPVYQATGPGARIPDLPDLWVACYDSALVIDEVENRIWLTGREPRGRPMSGAVTTLGREPRSSASGSGHEQWLSPPIAAASPSPSPPMVIDEEAFLAGLEGTRTRFVRGVSAVREHLLAGDVYQVNLSWPLRFPWLSPSLDLVLAHRRHGRVPYGAWLDLGDAQVACFSPERFLTRRGREVATSPIKGTRPRGASATGDRRLLQNLRESAKDRAEHVMIVDLERNDLGRVCQPGSIRVDPLLATETFPSVHHLVSTVHGTLAPDIGPVDLLRATFPGGSITGAPKIRAIEILRALEGEPRRLYTGAIGTWDAGGDMDLAIAIRTAIVAGQVGEYRIGGGIVIDSDPADEWRETIDKARGLVEVLTAGRTPSPENVPGPAHPMAPAR